MAERDMPEDLVARVSEDVLLAVASDLSLSSDGSVSLASCREAAEVLFLELLREGWVIQPPAICESREGAKASPL